jgi:hypothetical protein
MAARDESSRRRIAAMLNAWIETIAALLEEGKAPGYIRADVDTYAATRYARALRTGEELPPCRSLRVAEIIAPPIVCPQRFWRVIRITPLQRLAERVVAV